MQRSAPGAYHPHEVKVARRQSKTSAARGCASSHCCRLTRPCRCYDTRMTAGSSARSTFFPDLFHHHPGRAALTAHFSLAQLICYYPQTSRSNAGVRIQICQACQSRRHSSRGVLPRRPRQARSRCPRPPHHPHPRYVSHSIFNYRTVALLL